MTEQELLEAIRQVFRKAKLSVPDDERIREAMAAGGHVLFEIDELIKQYQQQERTTVPAN